MLNRQERPGELFRDQDCHPLAPDALDRSREILLEKRRKSKKGFVHEQEPGLRHQGHADRHHLLLSSAAEPGLSFFDLLQMRKTE